MSDSLLFRWARLQPGGVPAPGRSHGGLLLLPDAAVAVGGAGADDALAAAAPLDAASTRLALHALSTSPVDRAGLAPAAAAAAGTAAGRSVRAGLVAHSIEVTPAGGGARLAAHVLVGNACAAGNRWLPAPREATCGTHVLARDGRRWLACDLAARVRAMGELPAAGGDGDGGDARLASAPVARVGAASAALNNRIVVFGGVTSRGHARRHAALATAAAADDGGGDDAPIFLNDLFYLSFSTELDEVTALADRIMVMYRGRVVGIVPGDTSRDVLGLMMAGEAPQNEGVAA